MGVLIKLEYNEVINRINTIYGECFDLSKLVYVNSKTKILIGCKNHNETYWFSTIPSSIFSGNGCPICKKYYENRNKEFVGSVKELESIIDSKNYIKQDVRVVGDLMYFNNVLKIYGNLYIDNEVFYDLGELNYIKSNLIISENSKFNSISRLEKIGGDFSVYNNDFFELGQLKRIGGSLNLRDTLITDLGEINYIGGNLSLPKRLEGINLDHIEIKGKIRFWNDKKDSKIRIIKQERDWESELELEFSDIHHGELLFKQRKLNGEFLMKRCFDISKYNSFILDNISDFIDFIDNDLTELYGSKYSFYELLFDQLKTVTDINEELPNIKKDKRLKNYDELMKKESEKIISDSINEYPFTKYNDKLNQIKSDYQDYWNGNSSDYWLRNVNFSLSFEVHSGKFKYYVEKFLLHIFSIYIDSLQNKFRVSRGVPKIGEGWVSETDLFYKLKNHFDYTIVEHHGKPDWLGRQHVDIWFSEFKIGVEYQGEQHHKPIDFFGGEEVFIKNQERDKRKRELFIQNESILIEVLPSYDFLELIRIIEIHINK
jgi:hypothetical protein